MTKICTDIEQSKKLIKLGLNPGTADMRIGNYVGESGTVDGTNAHYYCAGESFGAPEIIDAWSLSALLKLIPEYEIYKAEEKFVISVKRTIALESEEGETPFDVIFNMICWLLEHDYIK